MNFESVKLPEEYQDAVFQTPMSLELAQDSIFEKAQPRRKIERILLRKKRIARLIELNAPEENVQDIEHEIAEIEGQQESLPNLQEYLNYEIAGEILVKMRREIGDEVSVAQIVLWLSENRQDLVPGDILESTDDILQILVQEIGFAARLDQKNALLSQYMNEQDIARFIAAKVLQGDSDNESSVSREMIENNPEEALKIETALQLRIREAVRETFDEDEDDADHDNDEIYAEIQRHLETKMRSLLNLPTPDPMQD